MGQPLTVEETKHLAHLIVNGVIELYGVEDDYEMLAICVRFVPGLREELEADYGKEIWETFVLPTLPPIKVERKGGGSNDN